MSVVADISLHDLQRLLDPTAESSGTPMEFLDISQLQQVADDLFLWGSRCPDSWGS